MDSMDAIGPVACASSSSQEMLLMPPPPLSDVASTSATSTSIPPQNLMVPMVPASGEPGLAATIQNVVSTAWLGCELDVFRIYCRTRFSEYNPQRFCGVVMRIFQPKTTALIFRSGKVVVTGARNEADSRLAVRKFTRIIQKVGYPATLLNFKIQNIVGSCDLRFPIRLENLHQMHGQFSRYEPELFPGLIYRLVRPRVVLLIFVNGKIVLTGAKSQRELQEALETIYPILRSFKKQ